MDTIEIVAEPTAEEVAEFAALEAAWQREQEGAGDADEVGDWHQC